MPWLYGYTRSTGIAEKLDRREKQGDHNNHSKDFALVMNIDVGSQKSQTFWAGGSKPALWNLEIAFRKATNTTSKGSTSYRVPGIYTLMRLVMCPSCSPSTDKGLKKVQTALCPSMGCTSHVALRLRNITLKNIELFDCHHRLMGWKQIVCLLSMKNTALYIKLIWTNPHAYKAYQ